MPNMPHAARGKLNGFFLKKKKLVHKMDKDVDSSGEAGGGCLRLVIESAREFLNGTNTQRFNKPGDSGLTDIGHVSLSKII
jgi:hypothetical protein